MCGHVTTSSTAKAIRPLQSTKLAELLVAVEYCLTAKDAEVFAEVVERERPSAYLCENLCVLCGETYFDLGKNLNCKLARE